MVAFGSGILRTAAPRLLSMAVDSDIMASRRPLYRRSPCGSVDTASAARRGEGARDGTAARLWQGRLAPSTDSFVAVVFSG